MFRELNKAELPARLHTPATGWRSDPPMTVPCLQPTETETNCWCALRRLCASRTTTATAHRASGRTLTGRHPLVLHVPSLHMMRDRSHMPGLTVHTPHLVDLWPLRISFICELRSITHMT